MAESRIAPFVRVVTLGALGQRPAMLVIAGRGMATFTIGQTIVAEGRPGPTVCIVALGTLPLEMVGRPVVA